LTALIGLPKHRAAFNLGDESVFFYEGSFPGIPLEGAITHIRCSEVISEELEDVDNQKERPAAYNFPYLIWRESEICP
jgi:hypothetical protein